MFYGAELVSVLTHLHRLRIVHRDIKPGVLLRGISVYRAAGAGNLLLDHIGHLRLVDYGLSCSLDDSRPAAKPRHAALAQHPCSTVLHVYSMCFTFLVCAWRVGATQ